MPETKRKALARAKKGSFPKSNVVKSKKGGYYISPRGIKKASAKRAYADLRAEGASKQKAAKIAHSIDKK